MIPKYITEVLYTSVSVISFFLPLEKAPLSDYLAVLTLFGLKYPAAAHSIVPGSQTYNSGSGNFVVQPYNTLIVEVWGGGASGASLNTSGGSMTSPDVRGNSGGASAVSSLSLSALGGSPTTSTNVNGSSGGVGGSSPSGGDTNTAGSAGSGGTIASTASGKGGDAPSGGAGGASVTTPSQPGGTNGNSGNAPGGGGSGISSWASDYQNGCPGGGSGSYCKKTYIYGVTAGAPAWGASLAYSVGAGGTGLTGNMNRTAGSGAAGRVSFSWS